MSTVSDAPLRRRTSYPLCGRLLVLETGKLNGYDPFSGLEDAVSIDFPSMPDSIEFARTADYMVNSNQLMPDGLHQYKGTQPLSIPFSFRLAAMDEDYCPNGALSLLQLAGRLHSFTLPLATSADARVNVTVGGGTANTVPKDGTDASVQANAQQSDSQTSVTPVSQGEFYPPVTLRLELIYTDDNSPGVVCTGYVRDVRVKFNGPWLRGQNRSSNLPSSADYDFTFVHVPGHGNNFSVNSTKLNTVMAHAYADDVRTKFYNTRSLTRASSADYKGFLT